MGELFAHFEGKWENLGKIQKKSRNFLTIFPSADTDRESWMGSGIFLGFVLGLKKA